MMSLTRTRSRNLPASIPIVHLVEAPHGMYTLDFCHAHESFMANFLAENETMESNDANDGDQTYIDGKAWRHLEEYSLLLRMFITKDNDEALKHTALNEHNGSPFILVEDSVREVIHTLLSIDRLFSWQTLVDAREQGNLQWKDIRTYLSEVKQSPLSNARRGLEKSSEHSSHLSSYNTQDFFPKTSVGGNWIGKFLNL